MKLRCLQRADACSLQPLLAFDDLELNGLALFERSVALGQNRALMHENVWAAFALDKAVALFSVKPLHCSLLFTHGFTLFLLPVRQAEYMLPPSRSGEGGLSPGEQQRERLQLMKTSPRTARC